MIILLPSSSLNLPRKPIMGEDDIMELIWKSGHIVSSSQTQRPFSDPPILRGSGSGGGEGENAPVPPPPPQQHQNIFIQEDEMASWLHHRHREDDFFSDLLYSGVAASQPQISISLAPPPPPPTSQILAARRAENFTNFARLRGNIITGTGPLIPVLRDSTQVDSSATPSSSAAESCLTPATHGTTVIGGVSQTFAVPGLSRKAKEVAIETVCEIAGTSSSGVCKAETEPIQIQPATETEIADDDRKRKEREETEGTEEARGSTSRKRSRAAEMHNFSERRRREKINEKMKALQELIPRCNKSDKASMLDDAIEYVKSLQMQIQMMSMGGGVMPMMYTPDMQRFRPQMAMGMMGMNRPPFIPFPGTLPFPRQAHMAGLGPSYPAPRYPFPASDPSRIHIPPSQQPSPVSNQPQFPGHMNPYSQFGLQQMQQPPPLLNQTTSQLTFGKPSSSKEPEDQENQPTDPSKSQF